MILKNLSKKSIVTNKLKVAKSFKDKSLGLLNPKNPRSLLIKTHFGIHTFFIKETIEILVLDKELIVKSIKTVYPNSIYIYSPKYSIIVELPLGAVRKSKTRIGDRLKMLE